EDGIRDRNVTGVQTCALPISGSLAHKFTMRKRAHVFYAGRVQGVGFRYTAREVACGYEVTGFVRNLPDGRVEMVAEGEEEEVRRSEERRVGREGRDGR